MFWFALAKWSHLPVGPEMRSLDPFPTACMPNDGVPSVVQWQPPSLMWISVRGRAVYPLGPLLQYSHKAAGALSLDFFGHNHAVA